MDVVGIDNPVLDMLVHIPRIPQTNNHARVERYSFQGGGKVSTAFVALGRLGAETGMIGLVGTDPFGKFCIEDFKRHHVDTSHIKQLEDRNTPLSVVLIEKETSGRSFLIKWDHASELTVEDIDEAYIASAKYLHLAYINPVTAYGAKLAKKHNVKVVIDLDQYNELVEENLKYIDVLIGSEYFYEAACDQSLSYRENLQKLRAKGPSLVVITLGDKGCVCLEGDNYIEVPAFTGLECVDTCGAGDVFHGAFIFGMLQGWELERTARFSCAVSSIKCTRPGGRAGIPDYATTERFLREGVVDYTELDERTRFYEKAVFNVNLRGE